MRVVACGLLISLCHGAAALAQAAPAGPAAPSRPYMMRADGNGDDRVSRDEYIAFAGRQFKRLDSDGDGAVLRAEVEKAADRIAARIKARMLRQFTRNDGDGDGKVLKTQIENAAAGRFAELDGDQDGLLQPSDFARGRSTGRPATKASPAP
jgi:hypothetical protein